MLIYPSGKVTSGCANVARITSRISELIHHIGIKLLWNEIFEAERVFYFKTRKHKFNLKILAKSFDQTYESALCEL